MGSLEMAAARSCILLLMVLFSFSSDHADGVIFPADTCHYIQQLITRFKESSGKLPSQCMFYLISKVVLHVNVVQSSVVCGISLN